MEMVVATQTLGAKKRLALAALLVLPLWLLHPQLKIFPNRPKAIKVYLEDTNTSAFKQLHIYWINLETNHIYKLQYSQRVFTNWIDYPAMKSKWIGNDVGYWDTIIVAFPPFPVTTSYQFRLIETTN
jgi:hypothetical protein